jgi:hypothetical protein
MLIILERSPSLFSIAALFTSATQRRHKSPEAFETTPKLDAGQPQAVCKTTAN